MQNYSVSVCIATNFTLVSVQRLDDVEINLSWSGMNDILNQIKYKLIRLGFNYFNQTFCEVYPPEDNIINNANVRHFWVSDHVHHMDLGKLELCSDYEIHTFDI